MTLTRRKWIGYGGAALAVDRFGTAMRAADPLTPATNAVDHFLLGAPDLDRAIAWVERLTGVKAVAGGSHPGVGTRNALLSLGGQQYLEIIAPDPKQTSFTFRTDIRKLAGPKLIGWAARTRDIIALAKRVQNGGMQVFGPNDGSRVRPDGKMLKWKTLAVRTALEQSAAVPFFIEWAADAVHPTEDSPKGCELRSFVIEHPDPVVVSEALKQVGIKAEVKRASDTGFLAVLSTPKGRVELR